jgi:superfamily II DNA or RNA helicase
MVSDRPRPSQALRERVFARSGGACQRADCGAAITVETFHVAHLRAHASGGPLHESNLEAWCASCNLTAGARDAGDIRLRPRQWQVQALEQVIATISQTGAATVSAAPGAGKTVFAGLVFEALYEAGIVDRMLVLVPRRGLANQWADQLAAKRHIQLKPHSAIERSGQHGAAVTYQSLGNRDQLDAHRLQASHKRTLLVLDEVHHVGERPGGLTPAWARNIAELAGNVETGNLNVAGVLNLSGTLWRSDPREAISTVRYRTVDENRLESLVDFEVTVGELVARGELRPIDLYRLRAHVRLADYRNLEHLEGDLSDLDEKPARAAMASLASISGWRSSFVAAVLDRLEVANRALEGHHVKGLIVANRQDAARAFHAEVNRQMIERGLRPLAELAVSDDGPDAQRALEEFAARKRVGVLCTVDMAGEGYDCPDIAVIGWASNKLTSLYVRQVTARAMRVTARERELERVIPAAVVVPDAQELVEQLVAYLAPFTHEVLLPGEDDRGGGDGELGDADGFLPLPRWVLEDATRGQNEFVTVAYADGSREDVDIELTRRLAVELERANVAGIYAPRIIAATRRTVGDLLASRPFDRLSPDAAALERLSTGAVAVAEAEASRTGSIEAQASMLSAQVDRLARWWQINGDTPASYFNREVNQAGGIRDGKRSAASVDQLKRARDAAREKVSAYCRRTGVKPPRSWEDR